MCKYKQPFAVKYVGERARREDEKDHRYRDSGLNEGD